MMGSNHPEPEVRTEDGPTFKERLSGAASVVAPVAQDFAVKFVSGMGFGAGSVAGHALGTLVGVAVSEGAKRAWDRFRNRK